MQLGRIGKASETRKDSKMNYKTAERNDQVMISFKVDSVVKESAEAVLTGMGLNTSAYLGMCLRKLAQSREIPFDLRVDSEFWVKEAQVATAASYLKTGLFAGANHVRRDMLMAADDCITESVVNMGKEAAAHRGDTDKIDAIVIAMKALREGACMFRASSPEQMLIFAHNFPMLFEADVPGLAESASLCTDPLDHISEGMEKVLNDFFCSPETIETLEDLGLSAPSEDPMDRAKAIESYLCTVLDAYADNGAQLAMRFVGSEFHITQVEQMESEIENAREKLKEVRRDRDNDSKTLQRAFEIAKIRQ